MKLTGAQIILESLIQQDATLIFGYPGGAILPTYDALWDYRDRIKHVLVRHEENAALAADSYYRATGKVTPVTSVSWKASEPTRAEDTWPVMATRADESIIALARPVTRFVAPGPLVAMHTPTLPVAR